MSRQIKDDMTLSQAIGALPRAMPPGRDLWPEIEQRLPDRAAEMTRNGNRYGWRLTAIAATVAVAFAAGLLLGRQQAPGGAPAIPDSPAAGQAMLAAAQAGEREYQAAFRQFTPIGSAPAVIGPQAVQSLEGSWQELLQAENALLAALEEHPDNRYLNQRLLDLRARQLQFMKQLTTLDQFSRRKI